MEFGNLSITLYKISHYIISSLWQYTISESLFADQIYSKAPLGTRGVLGPEIEREGSWQLNP